MANHLSQPLCFPVIQITNVKPMATLRPEYAGPDVPVEAVSFYLTNEVDTFMFDRPYYREDRDKNNEFKVGG